jgi:hypothetical protein
VNTPTLKNNDKNSSDKRLIAKKMKLTFKTQVIDRRQFQGITIINNVNNDLFIFCFINKNLKARACLYGKPKILVGFGG